MINKMNIWLPEVLHLKWETIASGGISRRVGLAFISLPVSEFIIIRRVYYMLFMLVLYSSGVT